ncbi:MAG: transporter, partial [Solirubrobacterales bacterium]|nr:transporter [Solirubrobacterales bacterium]
MLDVLRHPGVLRAFLSSCVAQLSMGAIGLLLILHTRDVTGDYATGGVVAGVYALALGLSNPVLARLADRRGQGGVLRVGIPLSAAALLAQAALSDGAPLAARLALALLAGAAQPPVGAYRRRLWPVLVPDEGDARHRIYATEGVLLEITYILGPVVIVGGIGSWSTRAGIVVCGVSLLLGGLVFARHPAVRALRGEPVAERDLVGALRAPGVVLTLVMFLALGVTVGAVEVGVPAALEGMGERDLTGLLLGGWGLGSLLGGVLISRAGAPSRPVRSLALLVAAWGGLHAALALAGSPPVLAVGLFLAGATIAPTFTVMNGLLDHIVVPGTLTEAFTWTSTGMTVGVAGGGAVAGKLADAVSPAAALA